MNNLQINEWKLMTIYCQTVECESEYGDSVMRANIQMLKSENIQAMNVVDDYRKTLQFKQLISNLMSKLHLSGCW